MQRKLLTNGNAFKRTDDRWGVLSGIWMNMEKGSGNLFQALPSMKLRKKMTDYISNFEKEIFESDESKKTLQESMQSWLQVFKFPSVEQTTYDRCER